MKKFSAIVLFLCFALQPVATSAMTAVRISPRTLHAQYAAQVAQRLSKRGSSSATYAPVGDYTPALPAKGLSLGSTTAPVTIVEFLDYACPSCAQFDVQTLPQIKTRYIASNKVHFVVRNFPLSFHAAANTAAQAVECSRDQNENFGWQLHDALLAMTLKNGDLTQDDVYTAIQSVTGIDTEKMYYCIDTKAKQPVIDLDTQDAVNGGINGTPSFWVLGPKGKAELVQGSLPFVSFQKVIETMMK